MSDDEQHHLAAPYALDALDGDERRRFEAHFRSCEQCAREVEEFRRSMAALGRLDTVAPPPGLKDQVMSRLGSTDQAPPLVSHDEAGPTDLRRPRRAPRLLAAVAAALVVVVGVGTTWLATNSTSGPEDDIAAVLSAADAITTDLEGTDGSGQDNGAVQVVWSPQRDQAVVLASGLDDPGVDRVYALWLVVDDGVHPAGLFEPDGGEVEQLVEVDDLYGIGWGVSIEPDGGSLAPTSAVIFTGIL